VKKFFTSFSSIGQHTVQSELLVCDKRVVVGACFTARFGGGGDTLSSEEFRRFREDDMVTIRLE
jgi:hypothetical protein